MCAQPISPRIKFEISKQALENWRSQFGTSNSDSLHRILCEAKRVANPEGILESEINSIIKINALLLFEFFRRMELGPKDYQC